MFVIIKLLCQVDAERLEFAGNISVLRWVKVLKNLLNRLHPALSPLSKFLNSRIFNIKVQGSSRVEFVHCGIHHFNLSNSSGDSFMSWRIERRSPTPIDLLG